MTEPSLKEASPRIILENLLTDIKELCSKYSVETLVELQKKLDYTLDFGCFFNPTAWINHSDQLEHEKGILEAFTVLREKVAKTE